MVSQADDAACGVEQRHLVQPQPAHASPGSPARFSPARAQVGVAVHRQRHPIGQAQPAQQRRGGRRRRSACRAGARSSSTTSAIWQPARSIVCSASRSVVVGPIRALFPGLHRRLPAARAGTPTSTPPPRRRGRPRRRRRPRCPRRAAGPGSTTAPAPTWQRVADTARRRTAAHAARRASKSPTRSRARRPRAVLTIAPLPIRAPACTTQPASSCAPAPSAREARDHRRRMAHRREPPAARLRAACCIAPAQPPARADAADAVGQQHALRVVARRARASSPSTGRPQHGAGRAAPDRASTKPSTRSPAASSASATTAAWPPAPMMMTGGAHGSIGSSTA